MKRLGVHIHMINKCTMACLQTNEQSDMQTQYDSNI